MTKRLLLVGAGHAHAQVLLDWVAQPLPGVELVLVSPSALAPYSGMVPGWLAGHYRFDEICIDFHALCAAAGARWVEDEVVALDADRRLVTSRGAADLDYTLLSLNIGSTLTPPRIEGARILSLRPLGRLREAWDALLAELSREPPGRPLAVTAVGGGAAGVESLLAARARLAALQPGWPVRGRLVTRSSELLPGMARGAARRAHRVLDAAGITISADTAFDGDVARSSDLVLWATGAQAHDWPRRSALALGEGGFIRIDEWLRSVSHPQVYAVGDCAEWARPLPKAGVFAVRMGPVLSNNLRAALGQGQARPYCPQRRYLALLATADGRAIAAWDGWSAEGRWAWTWKDGIDREFVRRFAVAAPDPTTPAPGSGTDRNAA